MQTEKRILFISHGGGPLPLLGDESHSEMVENLKLIASKIKKPSAILMISAHWEAKSAAITSGAEPELIYDYHGFPEESYSIEYPAKGEPRLAETVHQLLQENGIETTMDDQRGFDHGLFVPLKIMYPDADIPCIQLSLVKGLDPELHLKIGKALRDLNYDNLLIVGSGFSFHNMRAFFSPNTPETIAKNEDFENWLIDTCSNKHISEEERFERLTNWAEAPGARYCHPREEHLLPLHVCCGASEKPCTEYFELQIIRKKSSVYLW